MKFRMCRLCVFLFVPMTISLVMNSCVIPEAKPSKANELTIISDRLTHQDTLLIERFEKKRHVAVTIIIETKTDIINRFKQHIYNVNCDILITENEHIRNALRKMGGLATIDNQRLFDAIGRQFNNSHHLWIPLSQNPLLIVAPRDTSNQCERIYLNRWLRNQKDTLLPDMNPVLKHKALKNVLAKSDQFGWLVRTKKKYPRNMEKVYVLSDVVDICVKKDSTAGRMKRKCMTYLVDKKRTLATYTTISLVNYSRNLTPAQAFVAFFNANSYWVASGRHQIPTKNRVKPNPIIRKLDIQ